MPAFLDLTGQTFGLLTVVQRSPTTINAKGKPVVLWECRCVCGKTSTVHGQNMKSGRQVSCGCHKLKRTIERNTTHGDYGSVEYRAWQNMLSRCYNPKSGFYSIYGKRGIKVCDRWRHDYAAFLSDMGRKPKYFTLDRIDTNGDYEPSNCRWTDGSTQARNRRLSPRLYFRGEFVSPYDLADRYRLPYSLVYQRYYRGVQGDALIAPSRESRSQSESKKQG